MRKRDRIPTKAELQFYRGLAGLSLEGYKGVSWVRRALGGLFKKAAEGEVDRRGKEAKKEGDLEGQIAAEIGKELIKEVDISEEGKFAKFLRRGEQESRRLKQRTEQMLRTR